MKKFFLVFTWCFIIVHNNAAQELNRITLQNLVQIDKNTFKSTFINHPLIEEYLNDYCKIASDYNLNIMPEINKIKFIIMEPETNIPRVLTETNLAKIDKERKMILLSRSCLLDSNILKATLFREISHYLGVPYEDFGIMSVNKFEGYSYAWLTCEGSKDIKEFEYNWLFAKLKIQMKEK